MGFMQVYAGDFFKGWWGKNQDFMLIRLFNPNDLIGCDGDINQSDSLGLCRRLFLRGGGEKIRILC